MSRKFTIVSLGLALMLAACAKPQPKPNPYGVDCAGSATSTSRLVAEISSVIDLAMAGKKTIAPAPDLTPLLGAEYEARTSVASGKYKQDLEKALRKFQLGCPVDESSPQ